MEWQHEKQADSFDFNEFKWGLQANPDNFDDSTNDEMELISSNADVILYEYCHAIRADAPTFTLNCYDAGHPVMYEAVCSVSLSNRVAIGYQTSKKKAKKEASLNMLNIIGSFGSEEKALIESIKEKMKEKKYIHVKNGKHALSELHRMSNREGGAVRVHYTVPPPQIVKCEIRTMFGSAVGEGSNKKKAKEDASFKLFQNITSRKKNQMGKNDVEEMDVG